MFKVLFRYHRYISLFLIMSISISVDASGMTRTGGEAIGSREVNHTNGVIRFSFFRTLTGTGKVDSHV